jgi:hypothetical protein
LFHNTIGKNPVMMRACESDEATTQRSSMQSLNACDLNNQGVLLLEAGHLIKAYRCLKEASMIMRNIFWKKLQTAEQTPIPTHAARRSSPTMPPSHEPHEEVLNSTFLAKRTPTSKEAFSSCQPPENGDNQVERRTKRQKL